MALRSIDGTGRKAAAGRIAEALDRLAVEAEEAGINFLAYMLRMAEREAKATRDAPDGRALPGPTPEELQRR